MNQIRTILNKGWLTEIELEAIKRKVESDVMNTREDVEESNDSVTNAQEEETVTNEQDQNETAQSNDDNDDNVEEATQEERPQERAHEPQIVRNEPDRTGETLNEEERTLLERLKIILGRQERGKIHNLRNTDSKLVKETTRKVNTILKYLPIANITDVRDLLHASAVLVGELLDIKEPKKKEQKEPYWKRRIEDDIKKLRKDLSKIDAWFKGKWRNDKAKEKKDLDKKYRLKAKGFNTVTEELRQRIAAKSSKIRRYLNRIKQFQDNRRFKSNQGRFFKDINGGQEKTIPPNPEEAIQFWNGIWGNNVRHNEEAEWIKNQKGKSSAARQENVTITLADVKDKVKKVPSWKAPGPDEIQGYWIKNFTELHSKIADRLEQCLQGGEVPDWLVEGRTILIMKDPAKGNDAGNYRPIACLNLLWKLLSGILSEKTYSFLDINKLLPDEQKDCGR